MYITLRAHTYMCVCRKSEYFWYWWDGQCRKITLVCGKTECMCTQYIYTGLYAAEYVYTCEAATANRLQYSRLTTSHSMYGSHSYVPCTLNSERIEMIWTVILFRYYCDGKQMLLFASDFDFVLRIWTGILNLIVFFFFWKNCLCFC